MIYLFPILAALSWGFSQIFQRMVLKKRNIETQKFQCLTFFWAIILMIPLLFFFWKLSPEALELRNLSIFFLLVIFAVFANLLIFKALKKEEVSFLEPAFLIEPLFVILIAILFGSFIRPDLFEINLRIIVPAIVSGIAILLANIKKDHLKLNKWFFTALLGSFFFAIELVLSKLILEYYSSLNFYFFRSIFIFLITFLIFKPKLQEVNFKTHTSIIGISFLWICYRVLVYYGYQVLGVFSTALMTMLAPVFVYIFANLILKEKLNWKNILASIIIVVSIIYAIFL
jgi:drug/metabolite transporter (DMT)-like permease